MSSPLLLLSSSPLSSGRRVRRLFRSLAAACIHSILPGGKIPEPFMIPGTELIIEIRRRTTCGPERAETAGTIGL